MTQLTHLHKPFLLHLLLLFFRNLWNKTFLMLNYSVVLFYFGLYETESVELKSSSKLTCVLGVFLPSSICPLYLYDKS